MLRRVYTLPALTTAQLFSTIAVGLFLIAQVFVVSVAMADNVVGGYSEKADKSSVLSDNASTIYRQGLQAYLNNDYVLAYRNWSNAAALKHPKSIFNLALMHERQQIPNGESSQEKAVELYKQAANLNYLPSYRYWARLVEDKQPELAQRILNNSGIEKNVVEDVAEQAIDTSLANDNDSRQTIIGSIASVDVPASDSYLKHQWILQQQDSDWTIQLLAYRNETDVLNFIDDNALVEKTAYFIHYEGNTPWYKLVHGVYSSRAEAEQARAEMPSHLISLKPWLRRYSDIKKQLEDTD